VSEEDRTPNRTPPQGRRLDRNPFIVSADRSLDDKVRVIEDQITVSTERTVEKVIENIIGGNSTKFGDYIDQRVQNQIVTVVTNVVTNILADFDGVAGTPVYRQPPGFWYASQTYDPNWPSPTSVNYTLARPNSIYYQPITFYEPGVITRAALGYRGDYSDTLVQVGLFESDDVGLPGKCIGLTESVAAVEAEEPWDGIGDYIGPTPSDAIMHLSIIAVVEPGTYWIGVRFEGEGPNMYGYVPSFSETGLSGWEMSGELTGDFVAGTAAADTNLIFSYLTTHFPVFARLTSDSWGSEGDDVPLPFELNEMAQVPATFVRESKNFGDATPGHLQPVVLLYKFA
jgi:hypothetical protein